MTEVLPPQAPIGDPNLPPDAASGSPLGEAASAHAQATAERVAAEDAYNAQLAENARASSVSQAALAHDQRVHEAGVYADAYDQSLNGIGVTSTGSASALRGEPGEHNLFTAYADNVGQKAIMADRVGPDGWKNMQSFRTAMDAKLAEAPSTDFHWGDQVTPLAQLNTDALAPVEQPAAAPQPQPAAETAPAQAATVVEPATEAEPVEAPLQPDEPWWGTLEPHPVYTADVEAAARTASAPAAPEAPAAPPQVEDADAEPADLSAPGVVATNAAGMVTVDGATIDSPTVELLTVQAPVNTGGVIGAESGMPSGSDDAEEPEELGQMDHFDDLMDNDDTEVPGTVTPGPKAPKRQTGRERRAARRQAPIDAMTAQIDAGDTDALREAELARLEANRFGFLTQARRALLRTMGLPTPEEAVDYATSQDVYYVLNDKDEVTGYRSLPADGGGRYRDNVSDPWALRGGDEKTAAVVRYERALQQRILNTPQLRLNTPNDPNSGLLSEDAYVDRLRDTYYTIMSMPSERKKAPPSGLRRRIENGLIAATLSIGRLIPRR